MLIVCSSKVAEALAVINCLSKDIIICDEMPVVSCALIEICEHDFDLISYKAEILEWDETPNYGKPLKVYPYQRPRIVIGILPGNPKEWEGSISS